MTRSRAPFVFVLGTVLGACQPAATDSPPPPGPASPPERTPLTDITSASVALPVYPPPAVPSVAPLKSPTDPKNAAPLTSAKDKAALDDIRDYCAPAVQMDGSTAVVGCACCPPFETCAPARDLAPVALDRVYPLVGKIDGSFSRAGTTESAMNFAGCEPHAANYGGTLLVEKPDPKDPDRSDPLSKKTKLRPPDYRSGFHPDKCVKINDTRGLDRLLCDMSDAHQGTAEDDVYVYDFTLQDEKAFIPVFTALDDSFDGCTAGPTAVPVVFQRITSYEVSDTNGDKIDDVVVHVDAHKGVPTPAYRTACDAALAMTTPVPQDKLPGAKLALAKSFVLTFRGQRDGTFEPTAETKASLVWMNATRDAWLASH